MIEQALAVASDNAETARKALEQRDELRSRIEKISNELVRNNEGHWCGEWLKDPYMEDHLGNIEGWLERYEALLSITGGNLFKAKQLLEEVLTVREMGPYGPLKTQIRKFLEIT